MTRFLKYAVMSVLGFALVTGCGTGNLKPDQSSDATEDAGHGHDYRTFHADGKVVYGNISDSYNADLVMYLAGNQFMVMKELIQDFQKKNPDIKTVYVETIPPGQILKGQLLQQGQVDGKDTNMVPDLYASVNLNHLRTLRGKKIMRKYMIYTHNKLELMVAQGNPKNIQGARDLGRDDLVQSHPNPLTEGIFKFYGIAMLKKLKLYQKVTADKKCRSCWAVPDKVWFTSRHHRETPHRIENGKADVGIVWTTEVKHAIAEGRKVEGVAIKKPYNMQHRVSYAIGILTRARNKKNARTFLRYLATDHAQEIYAKYGFIKASKRERRLRWIPRPRKSK